MSSRSVRSRRLRRQLLLMWMVILPMDVNRKLLRSRYQCETSCGSLGSTVCQGVEAVCQPPVETCNAVDDTCDGSCDGGNLGGCRDPFGVLMVGEKGTRTPMRLV